MPPSAFQGLTYTYQSDGTYIIASDGVQSGSGSFTLYDNGQTINTGLVTYHIATLNSSTLVLVDTWETFPYSVNGNAATCYGERDT